MPKLSLALLGPFQVTLDGEPVSGLSSAKARALLAYLAVESDRAHPREALAELLWPDHLDESALDSLRHALAQLRRVVGDQAAATPLILVTRDTLRLNPAGDIWTDTTAFRALLKGGEGGQGEIPRLERATALYRDEFLAGCPTGDSPALDDWVAFQRAELSRLALSALQRLAAGYEAAGEMARVEASVRRQLAVEPWREEAHRDLMRILALSGKRSAALAQFEVCRRALKDELDVEPDRETAALYRRIREGSYQPSAVSHQPSAAGAQNSSPITQPFVAREAELDWLDRQLHAALDGRGSVALITGEAGSGKTALLSEFARRAMEAHGEVVAVFGSCNAQTGLGDPYLPFREALQVLAGDVESKRAGGAVSPEHARRLWALLPEMLQAMVESGSDLIDLLVPGQALLARAQALGPGAVDSASLGRLEKLLERRPARQGAGPRQAGLFEQVTRVLHCLAGRRPLVVALDDLQWADRGSISLLFHLGRRLAGSRILVLGAYRPDDVAMGRGEERHPLEQVVNELERDLGEMRLDLDAAEGRRFVELLLATEPNRLDEAFRERLFRRTGGHALFTVELLRGLQERGDLVRDGGGRWVEGPRLDWERIPARVEAVIAERVGRLPKDMQRLLVVASVEGEEFTAEVAARIQGAEGREVVRILSGPLGMEHRLVAAKSVRRIDDRRLSGYRFRHSLFQQYLYGRIDEVERAELHEAVGLALEGLHGPASGEVALQLTRHFEAAGLVVKAVDYRLEAGNGAMRLYAWQEARGHFERGLELLATLPDSPERDRREVDLQLALGSTLLATDGFGSKGQIAAYARAYDVSQKVGTRVQLWPALHALANTSNARGEYRRALELGEQLLALAGRSGESWLLALAHFMLGATLFSSGVSLARSREQLEKAILFYEREPDPDRRAFLTSVNTFDVGVNARAWLANVLWILGYPDQAAARGREALASAQQLGHFLSLVLGLYAASHTHQRRGEDGPVRESVQRLQQLIAGKKLLVGDVWVEVFGGWLTVREGRVEEGLGRIREGTAAWQRTGAIFGTTAQLIVLAEACLLAGRAEEGLEAIGKGLAVVERTGARPNEADLHWWRGRLLLSSQQSAISRQLSVVSDRQPAVSDPPPAPAGGRPAASDLSHASPEGADREREAEACFLKALEVARQQEARSYELRAATSLAGLWAGQGRRTEAGELLAPIYGWFTEGFETPDLRDARRLLAGL
jgi:DNA-binding SARP family transcriptional activator/tetratricopeptide (TPR) repeat protein